MFKRAHHYLTAFLVVTMILAEPMKISAASTPAQGPPGYPAPPDGLSYNVWRSEPDPTHPFYHMEFYGPNGSRWFLEVPTEIINGEEIIQDIQVSFFEIGWPTPVYLDLFPVECEAGFLPDCRQCIIDEVTLCYEAFYGKSIGALAALTLALAGCLRLKFAPAFIVCLLAAGTVALVAICLSVVEYQNCYRDIPRKCNARFPGCINAAIWGLYIETCLTYARFPR